MQWNNSLPKSLYVHVTVCKGELHLQTVTLVGSEALFVFTISLKEREKNHLFVSCPKRQASLFS